VNRSSLLWVLVLIVFFAVSASFFTNLSSVSAEQLIKIYIDGEEIETDVQPFIVDGRTMVPVRFISEGLGMHVAWDEQSRSVIITSKEMAVDLQPEFPEKADFPENIEDISIMGESLASREDLKAILWENNPDAPDLVDYYLDIGREYGIRGDIAFCQAAKETGWWKFGNLVKAEQNNYCGLGATGSPATGDEDLRGADPSRIWFEKGMHGAFFDCPATGVEAHIQHLYAYASKEPLPEGKVVVDPRFNLVNRGIASCWLDLGGKWAYPGYDGTKYGSLSEAFDNCDTYGHSIINNYYIKAFSTGKSKI